MYADEMDMKVVGVHNTWVIKHSNAMTIWNYVNLTIEIRLNIEKQQYISFEALENSVQYWWTWLERK
jgi:hypothetical protein